MYDQVRYERLQKIQCPVLTTGSFEDEVLDCDATMEIAEKLDYKKDFRLYMYTGFGHASFDTAPNFRSRMYEFFMQELRHLGFNVQHGIFGAHMHVCYENDGPVTIIADSDDLFGLK